MLARWLSRAAVVLLVFCSTARVARADGPFEGDWRQGAMSIDVRVETWGPDCGPRPQSSTVPGRGAVAITQDGDHLSFGGRRTTRGCWSDNRAVRVVSSRVQSGSWQILCRTPPDDPRRETGTYTLRASGNERIELRDETDYDWTLNESHCTARVTTTQTFDRTGSGSTPPPTTTTTRPPPTTTAEPPEPACTPGAPARVTVRPGSTDAAIGDRVCFTGRVYDAQGCWVRGSSVDLSVAAGDVGALRSGCIEVARAGEATIVGRSGALEGRATLRAVSMDLSGLIARRGESGVVGSDEASAGQDAGVAARTAPSTGGVSPWLLVVAALAIGLASLTAIALTLRARSRRSQLAARAAQRASIASSMPLAPIGGAAASSTPSSAGGPAGESMICPMCRRGYAAGTTTCSKDQERLVPYAEFVTKREQSAPERVCPTCGTHYPSTTKFCGKDGTTL